MNSDVYQIAELAVTIKKSIKFQEKLCYNDEELLLLSALQLQCAIKNYRQIIGNIETRKILEECLELIPDQENRNLH